MRPLGWKLFYADASTFSSNNGPWADAPNHGVQVLLVVFDKTYQCWHADHWETHRYRNIYHGATAHIDYYWMLPSGELGAGNAEQIPPDAVVKEGSWASNFPAILDLASQDKTWP